MTSPSTSGRSKLHKRVHFGSCSGGDLSITVHSISKRFTVLESLIQLLHFLLCYKPIKHFCSLAPKMGLKWTLRKWLVLIFSKTTEAINPQVDTNVVPEGLYILTGNDIISKSHKRVHFGSCLGRIFISRTVRQISRQFTVFERVIQVRHFLLCKPLDIFVS